MPYVKHPDFPNDVREVSKEDLKDWTDAGWDKVAQKDEAQAEIQLSITQPS